MAKKSVRRKPGTTVAPVRETIRSEVMGILIIGLACLGFVVTYSEQNGVVGSQFQHLLNVLAGGGRAWLLVMVGAWGVAVMRQYYRPGWRAAGIVVLFLVLEGLLHLQLPGAGAFSQSDMLYYAKLGRGGGLIGAGVAMLLKNGVGMIGSYVILGMGALIGALLVVNRSLLGGLGEAKRMGRETGKWVKDQLSDFVFVVKEQDESKAPGS